MKILPCKIPPTWDMLHSCEVSLHLLGYIFHRWLIFLERETLELCSLCGIFNCILQCLAFREQVLTYFRPSSQMSFAISTVLFPSAVDYNAIHLQQCQTSHHFYKPVWKRIKKRNKQRIKMYGKCGLHFLLTFT